MGMRTAGVFGSAAGPAGATVRSAGSANAAYASGGTSSFPVTGFPASAYLGNNRRVGGGQYGAGPSAVSSALGNIQQLDNKHVIIILVIVFLVGYGLWHLDNRR